MNKSKRDFPGGRGGGVNIVFTLLLFPSMQIPRTEWLNWETHIEPDRIDNGMVIIAIENSELLLGCYVIRLQSDQNQISPQIF